MSQEPKGIPSKHSVMRSRVWRGLVPAADVKVALMRKASDPPTFVVDLSSLRGILKTEASPGPSTQQHRGS